MKLKERFSLVEFTNRSGTKSFRVTGRKMDGSRVRANFQTYEEAVGEKSRLEIEANNQSVDRIPKVTCLTDEELRNAESATSLLNGKDLLEAAKYYAENYREPVRQIPLSEAFQLFLKDKIAANCRTLTVKNLKTRVGRFVKLYPAKPVSHVDSESLREFIFRPGLKPSTKDNNRRALSSFFTWAERLGYCKPSPMREISAIRVDRHEPQILNVAEINKVLAAARLFNGGVMLPYIALSLFAGIRPNELLGLTWENIDLEEKLITVNSGIAKMRQRRLVDLSDNLVDWLTPHALKGGKITPSNFRRDFDTVKALAGFAFAPHRVNYTAVLKAFPEVEKEDLAKRLPWTPDVLRHTAISYHLAQHQHEGKTASWAGNSPDIIQKHYKGLVKPKDAAWFWTLKPKSAKTVKAKFRAKAKVA